MTKLALLILFLYLLIAYFIRWFVVSNSPEYLKKYGAQTLASRFPVKICQGSFLFFLEFCSYIFTLTILAADYFYHYLIIYFYKPIFKIEKASKPFSKNQPPILLLHGYMMRGWVLIYIKKRLEKDGWDQVYMWNYMPPFKNIPYYAEQLKEKVDDILEKTGHEKIILIAHSMGGLLARYYIDFLNGKSYVEKLITLGTPHNGTQLWSFTYSSCGIDMRPGSDFLKNLKPIPSKIKVLSIYSSFDEIVLPYQSSILKWENVKNKEFDDLGHMRLIFSPKVYEEIHLFLSKDNRLDKKFHK